jgi:hypothetical protein
MNTAYLCKCNHCDGIFIDENPSAASQQYDLANYPDIQPLQLFFVELNSKYEPDYWGCPVCCTDSGLIDL